MNFHAKKSKTTSPHSISKCCCFKFEFKLRSIVSDLPCLEVIKIVNWVSENRIDWKMNGKFINTGRKRKSENTKTFVSKFASQCEWFCPPNWFHGVLFAQFWNVCEAECVYRPTSTRAGVWMCACLSTQSVCVCSTLLILFYVMWLQRHPFTKQRDKKKGTAFIYINKRPLSADTKSHITRHAKWDVHHQHQHQLSSLPSPPLSLLTWFDAE